jgi:hypothetical protein
MQQPLPYILQTLFQHDQVFVITPTLALHVMLVTWVSWNESNINIFFCPFAPKNIEMEIDMSSIFINIL